MKHKVKKNKYLGTKKISHQLRIDTAHASFVSVFMSDDLQPCPPPPPDYPVPPSAYFQMSAFIYEYANRQTHKYTIKRNPFTIHFVKMRIFTCFIFI